MICMEMFRSMFQIITVTFITVKLRKECKIRKARKFPLALQNVVRGMGITGAKKLTFDQRLDIQELRPLIHQPQVSGSALIPNLTTCYQNYYTSIFADYSSGADSVDWVCHVEFVSAKYPVAFSQPGFFGITDSFFRN